MAAQPTLARRYAFKLLANLASVPVYLVMEALLPRALGPGTYGAYSFATNLFLQFSGFLDMGSSTCFYNALSRRPREAGLVVFYMRICLCMALLFALAAAACLWAPIGDLLLPQLPLRLAPLAALWAYLAWLGRVLRSMNDAYGETAPSETWRIVTSLLGLLLLCILFYSGSLDLNALFMQQYLVLFAAALMYWLVCKSWWKKSGIVFARALARGQLRIYGREFFDYSHPLFVQALLSFFMLTAERWLLQWFDGSVQQGFYALSQKAGMACFLFVSAMTPLLMREFSIAWGRKDLAAMGALLSRFAPLLYALAAYFSCFAFAEAAALVEIFGGAEFAAAVLPVQIMALYPLHQAYGQMAGSVFHAAGRTKILRDVAACECVYGFCAAWFLLAPPEYAGFNLGATGLALKTVGVQIITVNLYLWLASRFIPFSFRRGLIHQLVCVASLLPLAFLARHCAGFMPGAQFIPPFLARFLWAGLIYTALVAALWRIAPQLLGLSHQELRELRARFRLFLRRQGAR